LGGRDWGSADGLGVGSLGWIGFRVPAGKQSAIGRAGWRVGGGWAGRHGGEPDWCRRLIQSQ